MCANFVLFGCGQDSCRPIVEFTPYLTEEQMKDTGFSDQFPSPGITIVIRQAANGQLHKRWLECIMGLGPPRARLKAVVTADGEHVCTTSSSWQFIPESAPNPDWNEYVHISHTELNWTVHNTPRIEVAMFLEIGHMGRPLDELGSVKLDTMPCNTKIGLLDLSTSGWHRQCRILDGNFKTSNVPPSLEFDLICWPPGQQRPERASAHPHNGTLETICQGGLGLMEVPEHISKQIKVGMHKWSTEIGDITYTGKLSLFAPVTLAPAVCTRMGIPTESTHFCFLYGDLNGLQGYKDPSDGLGKMILNGAFCYVAMNDAMMACGNRTSCKDLLQDVTCFKAIIENSRADINFGSFAVLTDHVMQSLKTRHYFAPVTVPDLVDRGFATFSWVDKTEEIDGNVFQHGAFVYTFDDGSEPIVMQISDRSKPGSNLRRGSSHEQTELDSVFNDFAPGPVFSVDCATSSEIGPVVKTDDKNQDIPNEFMSLRRL